MIHKLVLSNIELERDWMMCNGSPIAQNELENQEEIPDLTHKNQVFRSSRSRMARDRHLTKIEVKSRLGIREITHWLSNLTTSDQEVRRYEGERDYHRLQSDLIVSFTTQWNMGLIIRPIKYASPHGLPPFINRVDLDLQSLLYVFKTSYKG